MSVNVIFLKGADGRLVEMREQQYDSEALLQTLLADHPRLLGGQDGSARLLLIDQEVGVPDHAASSGRWALDHLFLDEEGVPTLVEVKRSSDTRIRREVVGQMLEYAANGSKWWPVEELRARFESSCHDRSEDPTDVLSQAGGTAVDTDEYWETVETNLRAGRIRMLFVSDSIPTELQAIVEFLNEQMDQAEVLAIEVKQYADASSGTTTLVPRTVGQTAEAARKSSRRGHRQWDEESFLEVLQGRGAAQGARPATIIFRWIEEQGGRIRWGTGEKEGTATLIVPGGGMELVLAQVWTGSSTARVFFMPKQMRKHPGFESVASRLELGERLDRLEGVDIPAEEAESWPGVPLPALEDERQLDELIRVMELARRRAEDTVAPTGVQSR